ncbi:ABC transporter permease [Frankia sp. Ag45/Mut15]|uniref:Transport permease protein n=1 Tax=Frankia umida TaxID=573489 RepID=A0ABT0K0R0_9ACTN|nr:ABC transporter permease [Frankia umida]MCK9876873.1 ABC transporter permease [Frankia umida]
MSTLTAALPESSTHREVWPDPGPARVSPLETLRHVRTLAWRNLVQVKHNPMELIDFSVQPLMFLLLFTYVFGGAIAGSTSDYLTFALPGLIVQNTLFTTLNTGTGLNTDLTKGVFDRLRSLPIARSAPLAGRILADLAKQVWAIGILLGLGYILGFRIETGPLQAVAAVGLVVLFALCASWIAVLVGMLVSEPEKVMVFGFTLIFPLTFVSNVFVQTSTMPGWLQAVVKVNPVTSLADATRGLFVGGPVLNPTWHVLVWGVVLVSVFAPLAVRAFRRRV